MNKIILLGANGHSAREIIPRLLEQDDVELTLFARRAGRINDLKGERVRVIEGDARNLNALKGVIAGQDVVISTMGGMDLGDMTEGVVDTMKALDVRRIVAINAGGIYDELPEPFNSWDKDMTGYTRPTNLKAADVIERSGLDYTILRPIWLTNKPTEAFELTQKGRPSRARKPRGPASGASWLIWSNTRIATSTRTLESASLTRMATGPRPIADRVRGHPVVRINI